MEHSIERLFQDGLLRIEAGGRVTTSEILRERLNGCSVCPHRTGMFCGKCNCTKPINAALAAAQCPDVPPRWRAVAEPARPVASVWCFEQPGRAEKLLAELESWRGTAFWSGARGRALKGVRADCVSFVESVMVRAGACQPIHWPVYVTHHGGADMFRVLSSTLAKVPRLVRIWAGETERPRLMVGDILAGSSGRAMHHVAIAGTDNQVWHCIQGAGVTSGTIQDPILSDHLFGIYRFRT